MNLSWAIDLDFASDSNHARLTHRLANKHGLRVALVAEKGPAGGNPLYRFTGSRSDLVALVNEWEPSRIEHLRSRIFSL